MTYGSIPVNTNKMSPIFLLCLKGERLVEKIVIKIGFLWGFFLHIDIHDLEENHSNV